MVNQVGWDGKFVFQPIWSEFHWESFGVVFSSFKVK